MPLSPEARSLAARCAPHVNELARRMARESFEELPGYPQLPDDVKDLEIAATARHGVRLFLKRVNEPERSERSGDHRLFRERAAQRAEEGMPLHLLLRTHALGVYALWQTLRDAARPGEEAALVELVDVLLESHPGVVGAVAETYLDERSALEAEQRAQQRSLVRGLLDGMVPPGHVLLDRLRLEGPSLVLALGVDAPPAEGPVAVRRRLRRMQTVLDQVFGVDVLALLDGDGGRVVVPGDDVPPEDLPLRLSRASGLRVRVAAVPADGPEQITGAARTATEILRITRVCGLPPGLHRLDDVLLEFHLSRPDESSPRIAALLDPVAERPELLQTLRTHLAHRQDRRATADTLGLHPNTVDNRLAKIAELTAIDLASPRGTALAIAALLLRDSENGTGTSKSEDGYKGRP
ncbi:MULTISPECIES: helix-turn-helix domain-containing protein [unclassified Streptomyces]|uniref:PucR family transcriptional regulator n=1 Tax=unclassified Streptomyces TaxID=2593676 RepID=UPI000DB98B37|nr:helix-turn-helix domain-containing protein [Streptomyces sp. PsTaAH-137]MYT74235.1 PucR family transcriptional regulator [Streptomyces sp. SID8367]RAJ89653.1 PucR-like helix-turn-helix protein [Streptomyces sp. PsTaAH-137]